MLVIVQDSKLICDRFRNTKRMARCRNCGQSFEQGWFSYSDFCSDGCQKDYEIKTRTLEEHDGAREWKRNALMLAEGTQRLLPGVRDLLQGLSNELCHWRKTYYEVLRDNLTGAKLADRVVST